MISRGINLFTSVTLSHLIAFLAVSPQVAAAGQVPAGSTIRYLSEPANAAPEAPSASQPITGTRPAKSLKPVRIVEVATGRSAEIRIFGWAAGRSAVLHFSDPELGSMELLVDSRGTLWTDDGVSVGGDLFEAAWKGQAIPPTGVARVFRTIRGVSEVAAVPYDLRQLAPQDLKAESAVPNPSGGSPLLARFSEFSSHLLAASGGGLEGGPRTGPAPTEFRIEATGGLSVQPEATLAQQGGFLDCFSCAMATLGYIAATAGLIACLTIILCIAALIFFFAAGWEFSRECATCL